MVHVLEILAYGVVGVLAFLALGFVAAFASAFGRKDRGSR